MNKLIQLLQIITALLSKDSKPAIPFVLGFLSGFGFSTQVEADTLNIGIASLHANRPDVVGENWTGVASLEIVRDAIGNVVWQKNTDNEINAVFRDFTAITITDVGNVRAFITDTGTLNFYSNPVGTYNPSNTFDTIAPLIESGPLLVSLNGIFKGEQNLIDPLETLTGTALLNVIGGTVGAQFDSDFLPEGQDVKINVSSDNLNTGMFERSGSADVTATRASPVPVVPTWFLFASVIPIIAVTGRWKP